MSRTRAALTALVLLSALALGGCSGDDPQPKFSPPASTSPAAPSTSAAAAMSPEETVRAWVDAQNAALRDGDTSAMTALSHQPCKTCDQFIEPVNRVFDHGGSFEGGQWSIDGAKVRTQSSDGAVVDVGVSIDGGTTRETATSDPVNYESEKHLMVFRLKPADDSWTVSFIGFIS